MDKVDLYSVLPYVIVRTEFVVRIGEIVDMYKDCHNELCHRCKKYQGGGGENCEGCRYNMEGEDG